MAEPVPIGEGNLEWIRLMARCLPEPAYKCVVLAHRDFLFLDPITCLVALSHPKIRAAREDCTDSPDSASKAAAHSVTVQA